MTIIIAVAVWAAAVLLLIVRDARRTPWATYAAIAIAIGVSLNVDEFYLAIDPLLGGRNLGDWLANASITVGVLFFARGIAIASDYRRPLTRIAFGPAALIITMLTSTAAFIFIDAPTTSTTFMVDYGDQIPAALYSGIQHGYYGIVAAGMVGTCIRQLPTSTGYRRAAAGVLLSGAALMTITCADVLFMDITHVIGAETLLSAGQSIYGPLNTLSFLLLSIGLVIGPIGRARSRRTHAAAVRQASKALEPSWRRAIRGHDAILRTPLPDEPEARLHREVVAIRDAHFRSNGTFLDEDALRTLHGAETLLGLTDDAVRSGR